MQSQQVQIQNSQVPMQKQQVLIQNSQVPMKIPWLPMLNQSVPIQKESRLIQNQQVLIYSQQTSNANPLTNQILSVPTSKVPNHQFIIYKETLSSLLLQTNR